MATGSLILYALRFVLPYTTTALGDSVGDFSVLQLAHTVYRNISRASGAHSALARQVNSLHVVLQRLYQQISNSDSVLNRLPDSWREELIELVQDCHKILIVLKAVFEKYHALSEKRSVKKVWHKVKFANGETRNLEDIMRELATYTQAVNIFLNLLALGELEKVTKYKKEDSKELRDIKKSLHWITADMQAKNKGEGSVLTDYTGDDRMVWKEFRRGVKKEGFNSETIKEHKKTIIDYVVELGRIGALDIISEDNYTSFDPNSPTKASPGSSTVIEAKRKKKGKVVAIQKTGYEAESESTEVDNNIVDFWDTEECQKALSDDLKRSESENREDKRVIKKPTEGTVQAKNSIQACVTKIEESDSYDSYDSDTSEAAQVNGISPGQTTRIM